MAVDSKTLDEMDALNDDQKKKLLVQMLNSLSPGDRNEVVNSTGFGEPGRKTRDAIWLIVMITFALVLLVAAGSLVYGVVFLQRTADNVQVVLTIFTAVVGFLAGLLSPSPLQTSNKNNQQ